MARIFALHLPLSDAKSASQTNCKQPLAFANQYFQRFYDFLFIKDPVTYIRLATLRQGLSETQQRQHLSRVWDRREKWCAEKGIRHQRIGASTVSRHYFADNNEADGWREVRHMSRERKLRQPESRPSSKQQRKR